MAREVNYNDPDSWNEDDKTWLKDRIDRVPPEHRSLLVNPVVFAPSATAESTEMERLRLFLERQFPEDMAAEGETAVGLAIRLLTDYAGVDEDSEELEDPGYEKWKAAEISAEIERRREAGHTIPGDSFTRVTGAAALRADDATK
jgi:hypothetical protein